jgi:cytochrome c nitrite reductase small subunit
MNGRTLQAMVLGVSLGILTGIGGYTFTYARGYSYLTDDPQACANCHIMQEQYSGWIKGSHRAVAVCNDCHTPSGVGKYVTKATNGFRHSFAFTTGWFHEPIAITPGNREITEHACRKCHGDIVEAIESPDHAVGTLECIRCHSTVGHP